MQKILHRHQTKENNTILNFLEHNTMLHSARFN